MRRILLVTDEYHSRRATLVWRRVAGGAGELISVPAVGSHPPLTGWWRNSSGREAVLAEYVKLLGYGLRGRL